MTGFLESEPTVNGEVNGGPMERYKYQLNAVLIHNGNRATSGHYICKLDMPDSRIGRIHHPILEADMSSFARSLRSLAPLSWS